jgi:hypothetical protein
MFREVVHRALGVAAVAAIGFGSSACQAPENRYEVTGEETGFLTVVGNEAFSQQMKVGGPVRRMTDGRLEAQIEIESTSTDEHHIEVMTEWIDGQGFVLPDATQVWEPITVGGKGKVYVRRIAPTPDATRLVVHVRPPNPVD